VTPTASERTAAINAFISGGTTGRVAALRSVADSGSVRNAELIPVSVFSEYYGCLRRNQTDGPDFSHAGYQFWLSKLNSTNGDFVIAFLISSECRSGLGQQ